MAGSVVLGPQRNRQNRKQKNESFCPPCPPGFNREYTEALRELRVQSFLDTEGTERAYFCLCALELREDLRPGQCVPLQLALSCYFAPG